jgi:hypothetical protein
MVARTLRLPTRPAAQLEVVLAHLGAERPDEVVGEEEPAKLPVGGFSIARH